MNDIKDTYLTIITIVKDDRYGLEKTYHSLKYLIKYDINFQWILVDGTSIPLDKSFIKEINPKIIEEPDFGIYNAMNKGIKFAIGKFLLFLNAGDILNNSKGIKSLEKNLKKENNDVICYSWIAVINKTKFYKIANFRNNKITRLLRMPSSHQSMLYKKDKLKNNLFDENFKICGDYAMYLNSLNKGWNYKIHNNIFLVGFSHDDGISTRKPRILAIESAKAIFKYTSKNIFIKTFISLIIITRAFLRYYFFRFLKI